MPITITQDCECKKKKGNNVCVSVRARGSVSK